MIVAVTGASGHLGRHLVPYLWERGHIVTPIGREWDDDLDAEAVIHLAAPDWRDEDAVRDFARFNERIARWAETTGGRVINTGSWWQYATGDARDLSYSRLKDDQQAMFGTTLVPFSIYSDRLRDGRGFIPQLVAHVRGEKALQGASRQMRDWIHVADVCAAYRAALRAPEGVYEVATGMQFSPMELVVSLTGTRVGEYVESPNCEPRYHREPVPGWVPRIDILDQSRRLCRRAA